MVAQGQQVSNQENLLFMPGIYNETLQLLLMAHDYFYHHGSDDQNRLSARDRSVYASEMSRITMRLSCIMAWLLARKAVLSGKLSVEDAIDRYRLDCRDVCMVDNSKPYGPLLPGYMRELLRTTLELYQRVSRLDDQLLANPDDLKDTW